MLTLIRGLLLVLLLMLLFVGTMVMCIVRPFHRDNVHQVARWFGRVGPLVGIKLLKRGQENLLPEQPVVYIGNHQNNFDLFTQASMVPKSTVSIGKKSLKWIPFFGLIYWLSGNILIDRKNSSKARGTIENATNSIRDDGLSVWVFPEGTRSRGRGLLPFKSGAFHTAVSAGVPIVPVLASCQKDINMGKWDNGTIIVEAMAPISTEGMTREDVRELATRVQQQMATRLEEINEEARQLSAA
ncbi:1-acylglycerol-3-phosphate O-acyltransferase [Ferrimonas lipolytica]|uniref:1-acyl-sn-glycerol-3-phosphate acyltransferase n=1 Tax=Ferrimonas lipolytica TaxID=2724191 RepID=A0A6H1UG16_9GAMM|nr:1-acylglycerol-3-phosphate O-acyltransferase [Ferrimonas lipolytica]QIZ77768.1 1-acylglycerol-3-phosphate O-acyltransferase [Ferrimonas lipolytica]